MNYKHIIALSLASTSLCANAQEDKASKHQDLQEVVVTGTGTQHHLKNAPVQTEIISRKMIDSYGGKSLEESLGGITQIDLGEPLPDVFHRLRRGVEHILGIETVVAQLVVDDLVGGEVIHIEH